MSGPIQFKPALFKGQQGSAVCGYRGNPCL